MWIAASFSYFRCSLYVLDGDNLVLATLGPKNDNCPNAIDLGVMTGADKFSAGSNVFATPENVYCSDDDDDDDFYRPANGTCCCTALNIDLGAPGYVHASHLFMLPRRLPAC